VGGNVETLKIRWRRFCQPNDRLGRFTLAQEEWSTVGAIPVIEEITSDGGYVWVAALTPGPDARANLIYTVKREKLVRRQCAAPPALGAHDAVVTRGPPAIEDPRSRTGKVVVARRLRERAVQDRVLDGVAGSLVGHAISPSTALD